MKHSISNVENATLLIPGRRWLSITKKQDFLSMGAMRLFDAEVAMILRPLELPAPTVTRATSIFTRANSQGRAAAVIPLKVGPCLIPKRHMRALLFPCWASTPGSTANLATPAKSWENTLLPSLNVSHAISAIMNKQPTPRM